jgi:hypothetical protein
MKILLLAVALTLAAGGTAFAQSRPSTLVAIDAAQREQLRAFIARDGFVSIVAPTLNVAVGGTLPAPVRTRALPGDGGLGRYRYTIINNRTMLVDPQTRRVIEAFE